MGTIGTSSARIPQIRHKPDTFRIMGNATKMRHERGHNGDNWAMIYRIIEAPKRVTKGPNVPSGHKC